MGRRERMSSVDTAWLRMDSQANLMQIVGVYGFNGAIEYERLRRLYEERFVPYERFRSCVVRDPTGYYWELDDNFDLDDDSLVTLAESELVPVVGERVQN